MLATAIQFSVFGLELTVESSALHLGTSPEVSCCISALTPPLFCAEQRQFVSAH